MNFKAMNHIGTSKLRSLPVTTRANVRNLRDFLLVIIKTSLSRLGLIRGLEATIGVRRRGVEMFRVYNYGKLSAYRAKSFESKEPDTLAWIDSMNSSDVLFDVGANIGIYTLYAATLGIKCIAFEPSSLNYAQLNLNIHINSHSKLITAFPLACHDKLFISVFNLSSMGWASALSSFDCPIDQFGKAYEPVFRQGAIGISLDQFCEEAQIYPTHLKIDVDGNEAFVINGALNILSNYVYSILIELSACRADHLEVIRTLEGLGFRQESSDFDSNAPANTNKNFIFTKG